MTWKSPSQPLKDEAEAVKWWLAEHFDRATAAEATWAIDLYATYLEAAIETKALPVVSVAMFGRCVAGLVPKGPYRSRAKRSDGVNRSGHQYLVKPRPGVSVIAMPQPESDPGDAPENGAQRAQRLYNEACEATGHRQTPTWMSFNESKALDREVISRWLLDGKKLRPPREGERGKQLPTLPLFKVFRETTPDGTEWTYLRFTRSLGILTRVARGQGGARLVAELVTLNAEGK